MTRREFMVWTAMAPPLWHPIQPRALWDPMYRDWLPSGPVEQAQRCAWMGCRSVALVEGLCVVHATVFEAAR